MAGEERKQCAAQLVGALLPARVGCLGVCVRRVHVGVPRASTSLSASGPRTAQAEPMAPSEMYPGSWALPASPNTHKLELQACYSEGLVPGRRRRCTRCAIQLPTGWPRTRPCP